MYTSHRSMTRTAALAALVLFGLAAPALARDIDGTTVPDSVTVDGKTLAINGGGVRKKFVFHVYVGALYLEKPARSLGAVGDQAWQVQMHFVRNVTKDQILGAFKEGFEKNSKSVLGEVLPGLDKCAAALRDLKKGDKLVVTYTPGAGSHIAIEGGPSVNVDGKTFAEALLRNWLGDSPADAALKAGMLGG